MEKRRASGVRPMMEKEVNDIKNKDEKIEDKIQKILNLSVALFKALGIVSNWRFKLGLFILGKEVSKAILDFKKL